VLVNNAGIAIRGAVEELSDEAMRAMFKVNVFGLLRFVRAVAPVMRAQKQGRIINIGSISGKWSMAVHGGYSASKHAVEGISDALRQELRGFGVGVALIEPGPICTQFVENMKSLSTRYLSDRDSPYFDLYEREKALSVAMRGGDTLPEFVSRVAIKALRDRKPRARYLAAVPLGARLMMRASDQIKDIWFEHAMDKVKEATL
jgi:short-subunit dehydrogenase